MIDLKGKVAVVFGLANKRSIAYSVAQKLAEAGSHPGALVPVGAAQAAKPKNCWNDLGQTGTGRAFQCDVSRDEEIDALLRKIAAAFPKIDILIHSVAFAPADAIKNDFLLTTREDFRIAHDVSVYSLIALARGAAPLMTDGRSHPDPDLLRRGKSLPQLQRDGRGQGRAGGDRALSRGSLGPKTSASMPSPPAPSRRWPPAASATSARS
jgi:NAD(P)-dependent dehydrogenase (short-subunit alcohol dehydrogenase family)